MTGGCRKLLRRNEEFHSFYCSLHDITVNKAGSMRWVRHAAHFGIWEMRKTFCLGSLNGRYPSRDLGVDIRIIVNCVSEKHDSTVWIGFFWLAIGTVSKLLRAS